MRSKTKLMLFTFLVIFVCLFTLTRARAQVIGQVDTEWNALGPNGKVVIEAFEDPKVPGATCYISYSKRGGAKAAVGLAEDTSDASIACRQTAPITLILPGPINQKGEEVFAKSRSPLFKKLHVVRFFDPIRNVLVYLTYTDELVNGSPKSSISVIPVHR